MYKNNYKQNLYVTSLIFILVSGLICRSAVTQEVKKPTASRDAVVTPSDVFATVERLNRSLDVLLEDREIKIAERTECVERGLGPMHVYQLVVVCVNMMHDFAVQNNLTPIPRVIVSPMKYTPADVKILANLMHDYINRTASALKIEELPKDIEKVSLKTPTDVFNEIHYLLKKLSALTGQEKIDPNKVFAELSRAVEDVKSILSQIDPACRFKVNAPSSKPGLKPADVYAVCLETRHSINKFRGDLNMDVVPVPKLSDISFIRPTDVYLQTQIIIAEINVLKMASNTASITPLAIPVTQKRPSDCHQLAVMIRYLLGQVNSLKDIVKLASMGTS